MERRDDEVHLKPEEARSGVELGVVRYVLGISLVLVILAFVLVYMLRSGHG